MPKFCRCALCFMFFMGKNLHLRMKEMLCGVKLMHSCRGTCTSGTHTTTKARVQTSEFCFDSYKNVNNDGFGITSRNNSFQYFCGATPCTPKSGEWDDKNLLRAVKPSVGANILDVIPSVEVVMSLLAAMPTFTCSLTTETVPTYPMILQLVHTWHVHAFGAQFIEGPSHIWVCSGIPTALQAAHCTERVGEPQAERCSAYASREALAAQ